MSELTNVLQTGSQLTTNYNRAKLFLGNNKFAKGTYKNVSGAPVTILTGRLMGKITHLTGGSENTVGYLSGHVSTDLEGANVPVGILAQDIVALADNASVEVTYAIAGDFDVAGLILGGSDTLATVVAETVGVVSGTNPSVDVVTWRKAIRELILSETQLVGVTVDQLSAYDNQ